MKIMFVYHIYGVATIKGKVNDIHGIYESQQKVLCQKDYLGFINEISEQFSNKPSTESIVIKSLTLLGERAE